MLGTDLWSGSGGQFIAGIGLALLLWFGRNFTRRLRDRFRASASGEKDVSDLTVTVYGAEKTRAVPDPPPGLDTRMDAVEELAAHHTELLATVVAAQGQFTTALADLDAKVTPNGGNTRKAGDLLLLIAQRLGIEVPEEEVPSDDG